MIKLHGRFELDKYWREVRQTGDDRLKDSDFGDWEVTLRPLTASDSKGAGALEEEPAVNIRAATKTLEITVAEQPELPPQSFVQTKIIDVIDQAIDTPGEHDSGNWLRDEGGEA